MTTKEEDFKRRFATLLQDLQQTGTKDTETMWVLGTLAAELAKDLQSSTWSGAKAKMNVAIYDQLLKKFQEWKEEEKRRRVDKEESMQDEDEPQDENEDMDDGEGSWIGLDD